MAFYSSDVTYVDGVLTGKRGEDEYKIMDDADVLEFFGTRAGKVDAATLVKDFTSNTKFWGKDLGEYANFNETVTAHLEKIAAVGMRKTLEELIGE